MAYQKKISQKNIELREKYWPELDEKEIWCHRSYNGFLSVPRTMPIIMRIIDQLTKGRPASSTYFSLWCMTFPREMYVSLKHAEDLAFHSGFTGQRSVRQWTDRMKQLDEFGFVKTAPGSRGRMSHAGIPNPHFVIRRLHSSKVPGLLATTYNTLVERASEIGAKDMAMELPEDVSAAINDPIATPVISPTRQ